MIPFVCPKCRGVFASENGTLRCENGHCFDVARSGYVNLLQSNQSSDKHHGDDKLMVNARRDFLDLGYYEPLMQAVAAKADIYTPGHGLLLDAGCGECSYTDRIYQQVQGREITVCGVDISKTAVMCGAKRNKKISLAVASVFDLPLPDESVDTVVNVFAPDAYGEFARVLKEDGVYLRVLPMENHLLELKQAVYESAWQNPPPAAAPQGFIMADHTVVSYPFRLKNRQEISDLFCMTPYYYKTSRTDQEKLKTLEQLTVTAQFAVQVLKKASG